MARAFKLSLVLALFAGAAFGDGIKNPTTQFVGSMGEGVSNPTGSGSGPATASLDFSSADNSQYMPLLGGFP